MARSRDTIDASLELLLDTITNTFGSVLFITMLVAVLLRMSGRSETQLPPVSKTEQARAEARVVELSAESDRLKATLDSLPVADSALARVEADIVAAAQEIARLMAEDTAVAVEIVRDQESIAALEQQIAKTIRDLANITPLADEEAERRRQAETDSAELAKLAVEIDRPVDPTLIVQTAQLPELSTTQKEQMGLLMHYGRVYVMHEYGPAGERLGPNTSDFVIAAQPGGHQLAKARPDAGHIADGGTIKATLRQILANYPADKWVVAIIVHEDSFAQFQSVKAALVELGYQYEPITARPGDGVWDSGGKTVRGQ